jgi:hypothetical protein
MDDTQQVRLDYINQALATLNQVRLEIKSAKDQIIREPNNFQMWFKERRALEAKESALIAFLIKAVISNVSIPPPSDHSLQVLYEAVIND